MKRFTSLFFGLNFSPFLLGVTNKYHMEKYFNRDFNSEIVEHFLRDLYMNDSISDAQKLLFQELCVMKRNWDVSLALTLLTNGKRFFLKVLEKILFV